MSLGGNTAADATIRIWDAGNGKHLQTLEGHLAGVSTIAWAPDSKTIASGSDDKTIRLWDVSTVSPLPPPTHSSTLLHISLLPSYGPILTQPTHRFPSTGQTTPIPLNRAPPLHLHDRLLSERQYPRLGLVRRSRHPVGHPHATHTAHAARALRPRRRRGLHPRRHPHRQLRRRRAHPHLGHADGPVPAHAGARGQRPRDGGAVRAEWPLRPRLDARLVR